MFFKLKELYSNFYEVNKLFLIKEDKNTDYLTPIKTKIMQMHIKFIKITSNSTQSQGKTQKAQSDKTPVNQKNR